MQAVISVLAAASGWLLGGYSTCVCECRHDKDLVELLGKQLDRCFDLRATGAVSSPARPYLTAFLLGVAATLIVLVALVRSGWVSVHPLAEAIARSPAQAAVPPVTAQRQPAEAASVVRIGTPGSLRALGARAE